MKFFDEEMVRLGGLITGETDGTWKVLVGLDLLFIPKSASKHCVDTQGLPYLMVSASLLENEKGVRKGVFRNRTEEERREKPRRYIED